MSSPFSFNNFYSCTRPPSLCACKMTVKGTSWHRLWWTLSCFQIQIWLLLPSTWYFNNFYSCTHTHPSLCSLASFFEICILLSPFSHLLCCCLREKKARTGRFGVSRVREAWSRKRRAIKPNKSAAGMPTGGRKKGKRVE